MYIENLNQIIYEQVLLAFVHIVNNVILACIVLLFILTFIIIFYKFISFIATYIKHKRWLKEQQPYMERMLTIRRKRLSAKKINELYRKSREEFKHE